MTKFMLFAITNEHALVHTPSNTYKDLIKKVQELKHNEYWIFKFDFAQSVYTIDTLLFNLSKSTSSIVPEEIKRLALNVCLNIRNMTLENNIYVFSCYNASIYADLHKVLVNKSTTKASILNEIIKKHGIRSYPEIVKRKNLPVSTQDMIKRRLKDKHFKDIYNIAISFLKNKYILPSTQNDMLNWVNRLMIMYSNKYPKKVKSLYFTLAENQAFTFSLQEKLIQLKPYPFIKKALVKNLRLSPSLHVKFALNKSSVVRKKLASKYNLTEKAQLILSKDKNKIVLNNLLNNPCVLPEIKNALTNSNNKE